MSVVVRDAMEQDIPAVLAIYNEVIATSTRRCTSTNPRRLRNAALGGERVLTLDTRSWSPKTIQASPALHRSATFVLVQAIDTPWSTAFTSARIAEDEG